MSSSADIQRWDEAWYGEDYGGMKHSETGFYVRYEDHVEAVEAAWDEGDDSGYDKGRYSGILSERDRIRQAVKALEELINTPKYKGGYDCCGCSTLDDLHEDILSIIDGGESNE